MRRAVQVYQYMSPAPHTVSRDATIADASAVMRKHRIHHLPVMDQATVIGLVSDRDLAVATRIGDGARAAVADAMKAEPYVTAPSALLADVADAMIRQGHDAAVVVDHAGVVGVFTAIDALRALAEDRGRHHEETVR